MFSHIVETTSVALILKYTMLLVLRVDKLGGHAHFCSEEVRELNDDVALDG